MRKLALFLSLVSLAAAADRRPPKTRTDNVAETLHGVKVVDSYRWLEDQASPETRAWIAEQNKYTHSFLDAVPGRAELEKRVSELLRVDVVGMPNERGGRYFFTKRLASQDLPVIFMRQGIGGKDEVLLDPHPMSPDHTTSVSPIHISRDGKTMVYGIRKGGEDETEVHLMDADTRQDLPDRLPRARYNSVALTPDKKLMYYSRHGAEGSRIYVHEMGAAPATDRKIFGDGYGPDKGIGGSISEDGHWYVITVSYGSSAPKTEIWYQDRIAGGPIRPLVKDLNERFYGSLGGDTLFVRTNWKAPNGRILAVNLKNPTPPEQWREVIPETKAVLEGFSLAGGKICVNYLENVVSKVTIFNPDGTKVRDIAFPTLGSVGGMSGRWEKNEAFFGFSSFHIPPTTYRYDVSTDKREVWSRINVPVKSEDFELKQVWYTSKDGTKVPMFLLYKKGLKLDGSHPTYLTGYGGFMLAETPNFNQRAVLWAERGGVFALANLRGGSEFGEPWHRAGMLENKQNVFDDFIAAAEYLIEKGYTKTSKLAIAGGSNGGLLVTAALTQRPDLYQAVICSYPLIDMVRYHKFMLARFWVSEYGSAEDAAQFRYIRAYSPYQHVKAGTKYPSVLFVTGDSDTRVAPLHARKMAALLQASTGSDRPVLLLYDTASGHSGGRPVKKQIEEQVDELSYLYWQLGVAK